jgi:hypothetical protein
VTDALDHDHKCFACGRLVADHEEHLHLTLDDWLARKGEEPVGLDDLFRFVFCSGCIEKTERGWQSERHEIDRAPSDPTDDEIHRWLHGDR